MTTWTEKYRPKNLYEIKGQDEAIEKIKDYLDNFKSSKIRKAVFLHGPPGTGKTTLAHAVAHDTNSEILELNASDFRDKEKIQNILKPASEQQSFAYRGKIILVDEVDGISGYYDKGGVQELLNLIENSFYPIIMTANDAWNKKLSVLRKKSIMINLKEIDYKIIKQILFDILKKEGLFIDNRAITEITIKSKGDLRAAINDIHTLSKIQNPVLIIIDERNKEESIFNLLRHIFKEKPSAETARMLDSVSMSLDEIMLWIEENIPNEYKNEELARAYEMLSKTDIFKKRIYRQQYWRFLVYENIFLGFGVSASKLSRVPSKTKSGWVGPYQNSKTTFTPYKKPTRILKMWLNNQRTAKKKSIAQKYARYVHIGEKRAMNEFPIIKQIIKSSSNIQNELKLNEEEIEYVQR